MGRILVLGAGAVGTLLGARLAAAGEEVVLIGRPAHVAAVRAHGVVIEGRAPGTVRLAATTEVPAGSVAAAILVTVKSFDLASSLRRLAARVAPAPTALLGNGLGLERTAVTALRAGGWRRPVPQVVRVVNSLPATLLGAGRVRSTGTGELVLPTGSAAGPSASSARALGELFSRAGLSVRTSARFEREVWRKAAVNAAINPVTARRRVRNGALRAGPAREEAAELLAEAVAVARASGVPLSLRTARADLARVVRATAENRSSMLQDVERGRPTEIEVISAELVRRGRALGIPLPATVRAAAEVRRVARAARRTSQPS